MTSSEEETQFAEQTVEMTSSEEETQFAEQTVEMTSSEEETQFAEQDLRVSHTAFSFPQLKLPEEKINCSFVMYIQNISEY